MTKRPKPATLTRFDRRSASEDDRIAPFLREMHHALLDKVRPLAWSRVLSVECGDGWVAEEAWRRLGRGYVCGVDISPSMTDLASRLRSVDGQLEFSAWDGRQLPFADDAFDYVLSTFAFHRFAEPLQSLREMYRVLNPVCWSPIAAVGQIYNLVDDLEVTVRDYLEILIEVLGGDRKIVSIPFALPYSAIGAYEVAARFGLVGKGKTSRAQFRWKHTPMHFDNSKARRELRWHSRVDVRDGLSQAFAWYAGQAAGGSS